MTRDPDFWSKLLQGGLLAGGFIPGVGEAIDAYDVGGGLLQAMRGERKEGLSRAGMGLMGFMLPAVGGRALAKAGELGSEVGAAARVADDLPMDEASRMQRARDMGFNVDEPLYHGTASNFGRFDPEKADSEALFGRGVYMTDNPNVASGYARDVSGEVVAVRPHDQQASPAFLNLWNSPGHVGRTFSADGVDKVYRRTENVMPLVSRVGNALDLDNPSQIMAVPARELAQKAAQSMPRRVRRVLDNAVEQIRREGRIPNPEGVGLWVDNTEDAYKVAADLGLTGDEFAEEYADYLHARGLQEIQGRYARGAYSTGDAATDPENIFGAFQEMAGDTSEPHEILRKFGFDGLRHRGGSITGGEPHNVTIAFDPSNIRSRFARFDPRKSGSADLLAGLAGLFGSGLLAKQYINAQEQPR